MRRRTWPLILSVVLMGLGLAGVVASAFLLANGAERIGPQARTDVRPEVPLGDFASNGERIYYTGVGRNGPIPREWGFAQGFGGMMGGPGMMASGGCVTCHRSDGRGGRVGMMGFAIDAPDITYETLTSRQQEGTVTVPAWDDAQIAEAIEKGVEPSGERLDPLMPRWNMDATDMRDTIYYLKELSGR